MFFSKFPLFLARIGTDNQTIEDFFLRVAPSAQYNKLATLLSPYFVTGEQRIEDVAFDLYGDQTLHWVIMLCNNITNPFTDWPINQDVLYRQVFDWYAFTISVTAGHGLSVGDAVGSTNGYHFTVLQSNPESVVLRSVDGVAYLSVEDFLYDEGRTPRVAVPIRSVDDPMNTIHHYEDVVTGYWVDFDIHLFGQGIIRAVSNLDYEQDRNEKKRAIRVLDKRYLGDFIQVFDRELQK
jgi:hypothetical protein